MKEEFIDVEFNACDSDLAKNKDINATPVYYSCKQVSSILKEAESTIRFWCKSFEDILNIEIVNTQRKYKKADIENLAFIQKLLREDNMSIRHVRKFFEEHGLQKQDGTIDIENPTEIKIIMRALEDEFNNKIESMQQRILLKQEEMFETMQENIISQQQDMIKKLMALIVESNDIALDRIDKNIENAIDGKIQEVLQSNSDLFGTTKEINDSITALSEDINQVKDENKQIHELQKRLEERRQEYESKKGFFQKIFNK